MQPSTLASALISSSVIPSAKNSFSGSGLRLVKGSTAIERGRLGCAAAAGRSAVVSGDRTLAATRNSATESKRATGSRASARRSAWSSAADTSGRCACRLGAGWVKRLR